MARTDVHIRQLIYVMVCIATVGIVVPRVWAGIAGLRSSAVGGVSIDVEGVVGPPVESARKLLLAALRKEIKESPDEMKSPVELRMISLKGLHEVCEDAVKNHFGRLPEEVRFLAGIQRIQYIFVYPEDNDIVLAGPGEGWELDENANVVGITTGRPVLQLDDLLVALRYVHEARTDGISCSIDPTAEGNAALSRVLKQQRRRGPVIPRQLEPIIKQAFGPQMVTVSGIPASTHFARVLVAADYRMKRFAMNLENAPVSNMPSYVELIKGSRKAANINPRWWMACDYEPLAASEDGLAWELRGPGVKVMTQDSLFSADGTVTATGRSSAPAQRWADNMTGQYDSLSAKDSVFGELRNLMDMCVMAAVIEKNRLADKAGLSIPLLTDQASELKLETWNAPKRVPPEVSFLRARNSWIVTASGGVQVESWQIASQTETSDAVSVIREKATRAGQKFWWQ
jgi:hypothetical protein